MFVPCVVVWWRWLSDAHLKRLIEYDVCVRVSVCCHVEVVGECASQMTDSMVRVQPVPGEMRLEKVFGIQIRIVNAKVPGLVSNLTFNKRPKGSLFKCNV